VNGNYAVAMPEGWTGSLSAENADCCYLTPPCWEFTEPLSAPQQQDFTAWCPPIGVPVPEFGLREQVLLPDPWDQPLVGFYYVDNTHPNASDSDNPYGYPDRPRLSMPGLTGLPAGTVIHVNAGDYYSGGARAVTGAGTPEQPVFIRGNPANRPRFAAKLSVQNSASYIIIENIDFDGTLNDNGYAGVEFVFGAHHVALRNSALHHRNGTCIQIYGAAGIPVHDILVYNSVIHDNGDWHADHDQDFHGIGVGAHVSDLSVLDNQFYHNSGNGVQVNAGSLANLPTAHHIYVARNEGHHNKQAGIALKQCQDVIVSQNSVHDQRPIGANPSDWGAGIGFQYGPENVWFLCNHIHDCCYGIYGGSTSGMGDGQNSYFIGNVIHDIHHDPAYPYNPDTAWSNAALMLVGVPNRSIINNTVYTVDSGINGPSSGVYELVDNIISNITEEQGKHIFLEHAEAADVSIVRNDLLYQDGEPVRIVWGSGTVYDLKGFQTATGEGEGSLDADARFVDEATRDLHLRADSPAVNAGIEHEAYATFFDLYGIDIRVDADGWPRPPGEAGEVDIGAFELAAD
jgi:hypothetical protein